MRRGEAPVAVAEETCVLGHAWQDGLVLCPVCGFGHRVTPTDHGAETVTVTAVVAMPAAREGEVTSATVSPDGHWAWDGDEWVPASMSEMDTAVAAEAAGVPAASAAMAGALMTAAAVTETGEPSTWAARDLPSSFHEAEPEHTLESTPPLPSRDSAPPSIPMPSATPADTAATRAAAAQEAQTLDDLARLLVLADVPDDDAAAAAEDAAVVDATVEDTSYEVSPIRVAPFEPPVEPAPVGVTPVDVVPVDLNPVDAEATPAAPSGEAFLEAYLEFEGPPVPADAAPVGQETTEPALETDAPAEPTTVSAIADTTPAPDPDAAGRPHSIVLRPATSADDDADGEDERPRRALRLPTPDLRLSPNGLRVAVVVVAAVVSTVIATGHSPFAHHSSAAPKVDVLLQDTLHSAAVLETRYASEHGNATLRAAALTPGGYRAPSLVSLTVARTSGQGYCLVGSDVSGGSRRYELWDSARGGLASAGGAAVSFPTAAAAHLACPGAGAFSAL